MIAVLLLIVASNVAHAAECVPVGSPISLAGVVEFRYDDPSRRGPFIMVLKLSEPVCVSGLRDGPKTVESFSSFQLSIPANLSKGFRDGDRVTIRGAIGNPAVNDPKQRVFFSVKEVR